MNIYNEIYNWDDLDFLFNRARWKIGDKSENRKIKKDNFFELFKILDLLDLKFYFYGISKDNLKKNKLFENHNAEDFIRINNNTFDKALINKLKEKNFIILSFNNQNMVIKDYHVIHLDFQNFDHRNRNYKNVILFETKFKIFFLNSPIFKRLVFKNLKNIVKYNIKFVYLTIRNIFYPYLSLESFLNLNIEQLNSKSWQLRKGHLDLVTNNKENIKVGDIVSYFKNTINFDNAKKNIIETDTSSIFEEPIYANKHFWLRGNNYFINNIIYQFRKDVVSYKDANNYIKDKNNIFNKKFFTNYI